MKKILVYGAGRQGTALAYALGVLGHQVDLYDIDPKSAAIAHKKISDDLEIPHISAYWGMFGGVSEYDAIVSTATYTANLEIAKQCVDSGVPYFDLGGNVGVSEKIQAYAQEANKSPVFTDLGLAPGLVNIIAEQLYQVMRVALDDAPQQIDMAVGGLPAKDCIPETSGYSVVFSPEGLINEYFDDCLVLEDGEIVTKEGMSELEKSTFTNYSDRILEETEDIEEFCTSGGVAHSLQRFKDLHVPNCVYKTIRYPGHHTFIQFLKNIYGHDTDAIKQALLKTCPPVTRDRVLIKLYVDGFKHSLFKDIEIKCDSNWTAMQKATAFPVAAIVDSYLQGYGANNWHQKKVLRYEHVDYDQMKLRLGVLGVEI